MNEKVKAAIIGGTGLYELEGMEVVEEFFPETAWGKPLEHLCGGIK